MIEAKMNSTVKRPALRALLAFLVMAIAFVIAPLQAAVGDNVSAVSFQAGDGWKITGTLYLPDNVSAPVPAVVLLTEPGWVDRSIYDNYLSRKLAKNGMAALSIDMRGTGGSAGGKEFEAFSPEELAKLQLDVSGAIKFLSAQKAIDAHRIGIVGSGITANYAVAEAADNAAVQAIVLISGDLSSHSMELVRTRLEIPAFYIAGKKDRKSLEQMAAAYAASGNEDSDLVLAVGHGTVMFSHTAGLEEQVVQWFGHNLRGLGTEIPVTFKSSDGWTLRGRLRVPEGPVAQAKMPGVVLVHGAKHDEQTYYQLAREAAKKGFVSLRFDWRGKGESINEGKSIYGVDLSTKDQDNIHLDVKAAIEYLATQKQVDASRIGTIAATLSCVETLEAADGDARVKTVVLLTSAAEATPQAKHFLTTSGVPIFAIASLEDNNYQRGNLAETTRHIYQLSNSKSSQLLLYDDAGRGSEMFKVKRELQPMVLRWLGEKLAK
jgi:dienelactone hydrolase